MKQSKNILDNMKQLKKIVNLIPADRKQIAETIVKELAFMSSTLDQLKENVQQYGAVDLFQQGSQKFLRESPALKAYNTTVQKYSLLYKQLTDLLPKQAIAEQGSKLYDFINEE